MFVGTGHVPGKDGSVKGGQKAQEGKKGIFISRFPGGVFGENIDTLMSGKRKTQCTFSKTKKKKRKTGKRPRKN